MLRAEAAAAAACADPARAAWTLVARDHADWLRQEPDLSGGVGAAAGHGGGRVAADLADAGSGRAGKDRGAGRPTGLDARPGRGRRCPPDARSGPARPT